MMKIKSMTRITLVLTLTLSLAGMLYSGSSERRGTAGAQELLLPVGSVGTALGGSFNALISGVEAYHWNPAGVSNITGSGEAVFSQYKHIGDIDVTYAGLASKLGAIGTAALTLKTVDFGEIPVTTVESPNGTGETYSPRYFTLGLTYSRTLSDRIRFGTTFNLVSETVMRTSASGIAINAGVQYHTGKAMIGMAIRNFGLDMLFTGPDLEQMITPPGTEPGTRTEPWRIPLSSFELPTQMEMGVAYHVFNTTASRLTLGAAFLNDNFSFDTYTFGTEFALANMFFVRGSLVFAENPDDGGFEFLTEDFIYGPAFGAGVNLKFAGTTMKLDYSMRQTEFFNNTSWLTVRLEY